MCRVARAWGYGLWEAQLHWNGPKDESWRNEAGQTTGPCLQTETTSAGLGKPWGLAVDSKDCGPRGAKGRRVGEE